MANSLTDKLRESGLSSTPFEPGQIWLVESEFLFFEKQELELKKGQPPRRKRHYVVVVSRSEDCTDPNRLALLVVPVTTSPEAKHPLMYPLLAHRDIPLPEAENSIALPHLVQPVLKVDLDKNQSWGKMPEEALWEIQARVVLAMRQSSPRPEMGGEG